MTSTSATATAADCCLAGQVVQRRPKKVCQSLCLARRLNRNHWRLHKPTTMTVGGRAPMGLFNYANFELWRICLIPGKVSDIGKSEQTEKRCLELQSRCDELRKDLTGAYAIIDDLEFELESVWFWGSAELGMELKSYWFFVDWLLGGRNWPTAAGSQTFEVQTARSISAGLWGCSNRRRWTVRIAKVRSLVLLGSQF